MVRIAAAVLVLLPFLPGRVLAQDVADAHRPSIQATPASESPLIDGRLDDAAWLQAPVAEGFRQREPSPGALATEGSRFQVVYDSRGIYFGFRFDDSQPGALVRDLRGRDVSTLGGRYDYWGEDDAVALLLDTYHDHRNAFYFSVNPNGAKTDALISAEGTDKNFDWDGVWEAAATVDDGGWTAEIFIPWTTLRFPPASEEMAVGLNVQRIIRRKTEETYWAPLSLDETLWWMSRAGHLEGLELPSSVRPVELTPFSVGSRSSGDALEDHGSGWEFGADAKIGLIDGLTADLTWNTDFAQVEVDEQQVNLTRFPLFFPEKRDFFLERAGLFQVGVERFAQLFFSRRIGLDRSGLPVPIRAGVRVTGRVGRYEIGVIDVQTDDVQEIPAANHAVVRVRRDLLSRSTVGLLLTNLEGSGAVPDNRVIALDLDLNPWRYLGFDGFIARTSDGKAGDDWGFGGIIHWNTDKLGIRVVVNDYGPAFKPAMGFLPRTGVHHYQPGARLAFRPDWPAVRRIVFRTVNDLIMDQEWEMLTRMSFLQSIWTLESADEVTVQVTDRFERLGAPFEIDPGVVIPTGDFAFTSQFVRLRSSDRRPLSGSLKYEWGDFWNGSIRTTEVQLYGKLGSHLSVGPAYARNEVELAGGSFTTNLARLRVGYTPDNGLMFDGFLQYNDVEDAFTTNLRADFIYRPGSHIYLVCNTTRGLPFERSTDRGRQFILKATYALRR